MPNVQLDENGLPLGLQALIDDTIKGLMRSIGDPGAAPSNALGSTALQHLSSLSGIYSWTYYMFSDLRNTQAGLNAEVFTTTALAANATYTGPARDFGTKTQIRFMGCIAFANAASATDGFKIELSINGTNWDYVGAKATVAASVGASIAQEVTAQYARVVFVNGATAQTVFRLGGRYY